MKFKITIKSGIFTDVYEFACPSTDYTLVRRFIAEIVSTQVSFVDSPVSIEIEEMRWNPAGEGTVVMTAWIAKKKGLI